MNKVQLFAKARPNERHWYAYDVMFGGDTIVSNSRDPEHDLARALLARGIKGEVEVRDGRTGKPRSRINVEAAARLGIGSNLDRYDWKSREIGKDSPLTGATEPFAIQGREAA
jgi:hypothetical protein